MDIWDIFMTNWYILCSFGTFFPVMYQEKSGNPDLGFESRQGIKNTSCGIVGTYTCMFITFDLFKRNKSL
jgi:hypothetical protein